jgi:hypothetical protein
MSDTSDLLKYSREQIINALHRVWRKYPAVYRHFFLYELEKPYSPFDSQAIVFLTKEDEELFNRELAPLKVLVPMVIEEDEQDT